MSRLNEVFCQLKAQGRKGLIVYLTAGCPDFAATLEAVQAVEAAGANIIEIGIPFSDPMADGPVIQKAASLALQGGATTGKVLELVRQIRQKSAIPLVVMTYINTVLQFGVEKFVRSFAQAGLDGLIVPDLPVEESALLENYCREAGLALIQFIAPTTAPERAVTICHKAAGFLYCISATGVTGVRQVDYSQIGSLINNVRQYTSLPVAIGFGIGSPQAAREAADYADAVIIGSAIMQQLIDKGVDAARAFTESVRLALDQRSEQPDAGVSR
ncbi:tryptophan synthase, alpha subunit [Thermosinus carboxydivorans Nor1]|uniref:Tryptophan synthase alpha chain n=1 Tax=Thermosinus carboxydivorans Nor1 TaxID=401526 RepID=A1HS65_9FIRM|nr:tryptophan synthase subunit alpha [Thermosinus carboxydivorans]EAX47130.1 tryptophan synthase, alpha subunit [Thermosinus carboxydivorans Nor1]